MSGFSFSNLAPCFFHCKRNKKLRQSSPKKPLLKRLVFNLKGVLIFTVSLLLLLFFSQGTFLQSYLPNSHFFRSDQRQINKLLHTTNLKDFYNLYFQINVTSDSITTAYTLQNPTAYQIPKQAPRLTSFQIKQYQNELKTHSNQKLLSKMQDHLHTLSSAKLTEENAITYTLLDRHFTLQQELASFPYYEDLIGPTSGVPANLPITLCEYPLRTKNDITCYFKLLTQVPEYFDDVIAYEQERSQILRPLPHFLLLDCKEEIQSLLTEFSKEQNCFSQTFTQRIQQLTKLSADERKQYCNENQALIQNSICKAYRKLYAYVEASLQEHTFSTYQSQNTAKASPQSSSRNKERQPDPNTPYGLSSLPNGKDYYTLLVESNTGSSKTVPELITKTDQTLASTLSLVQEIALSNPKLYLYYCDHEPTSTLESPKAILDTLALQIRQDYPPLPQTPSYKIKTVPKSLATHLSPAFYMLPAIDAIQENTIYINPLYTSLSKGNLFPTLAHEGFPGHLYQTNYFQSTNPPLVRHILDFPGYVEGWATYVELNSFSYLNAGNNPSDLTKLYQSDTIISLALSARVDLGVNYESWTLNDVNRFFQEQGFQSYYGADLYSYVVESPATYLRYFIGYLEIEELKTLYQKQQPRSDNTFDFHKRFLTLGPADFQTLRTFFSPSQDGSRVCITGE